MSDGFQGLLDDGDELQVPPGYRVEIIRGNIVLSPWPPGYYARVMNQVCEQLSSHLPEGHIACSGRLLYVFPSAERAYEPDIHVVHRRKLRTTSNRMDGTALSFVAELTLPSTRDVDFTDKVETYGKAGVPVYLLLDMQEEQATVYWTPSAKGYESCSTRPFGGRLSIPAPFDCTLDTTGFEPPKPSAT
ncbi:Uma2 family endonuclease [Streptomyces sp. NPDC002276]